MIIPYTPAAGWTISRPTRIFASSCLPSHVEDTKQDDGRPAPTRNEKRGTRQTLGLARPAMRPAVERFDFSKLARCSSFKYCHLSCRLDALSHRGHASHSENTSPRVHPALRGFSGHPGPPRAWGSTSRPVCKIVRKRTNTFQPPECHLGPPRSTLGGEVACR